MSWIGENLKRLIDYVKYVLNGEDNSTMKRIYCLLFFPVTIGAVITYKIFMKMHSRHKIVNEEDKIILKQGLKNHGNTCFMNSILQFLFAAVKLRKHLIQKKYYQKNNRYLISKIFQSMNKGQQAQKRDHFLKKLTLSIEQMGISYKFPQQADSIHILLNILDKLKQQDSQIMNFFNIQYCEKCGCEEVQNTLQVFIPANFGTCYTCKQKNTIQIHSPAPKYLLMVYRGQQQINQTLHFDEATEHIKKQPAQKIQYQMIAVMNYQGNGYSGHFKAHRKGQDHEWYECNDSRISFKGKLDRQQVDMAMYELKEKNEQGDQKQSSSLIF